MKNFMFFAATVCLALVLAGCGGGGGGGAPSVAVPTDPAVITTTASKKSVSASASVINPNGNANSPTRLGARAVERVASRVAEEITSNLGDLEGNVGETYYITYTNEPLAGCTVNGTLGGTVTVSTQTSTTLSLSGTLNYTSCTSVPNMSVTITSGSIAVVNSTMTMTMPTHYTFPGKQYTTDLTVTVVSDVDQGSITRLTYVGTDSLGNSFNNVVVYETATENSVIWNRPKTYTNDNVIDGTRNRLTCTFNHAADSISCTGTSTTSNGIVLTYAQGGMTFSYTEETYMSGSVWVALYKISSGSVSFTTNTGYTGTLAFNADQSGSGTIKNSSGATVGTLSWTTSGYCTLDYDDANLTDEQFYLTGIQQALA